MGKKSNRIGKIPAFIKKLKDILEDKSLSDTIQWLPEGNGFQILNTTSFTDKVLPLHFKHRNIASFVRQLNMYGFNRPKDSGQNIYIHPRFLKGNLNSMKLIKRKAGHQKQSQDESSSGQSNVMKKTRLPRQQNQVSDYQKLYQQNQTLRKQNQDLLSKLSLFQGMMEKIKLYTQKIQKHISIAEEAQVDKIEKQVNSSNSSNSSNESLLPFNSNSNRKGFSLCSSSCSPHYESSYQILLQGQQQRQETK